MMRVLFVSSGNNKYGISPIIHSQGRSLSNFDINIEYYAIVGKGIRSYLRHIFLLKKFLLNNKFDIIHTHYSLSAFVASIASAKPLVVSLMGSDIRINWIYRKLIIIFYWLYWDKLIVKSDEMKNTLGLKKCIVIPNGVNLSKFKPLDQNTCRTELGWSEDRIHILFLSNPARHEKNFLLTEMALKMLKTDTEIELHYLSDLPHDQIPNFINAANVAILSSLWEGSPNAIKEAMACNCPIVATNVGDIHWLFGMEQGYFITDFTPEDVAIKLSLAIEYSLKYFEVIN
jgi:glycosyltransferase involved in cell wall biosynthesis